MLLSMFQTSKHKYLKIYFSEVINVLGFLRNFWMFKIRSRNLLKNLSENLCQILSFNIKVEFNEDKSNVLFVFKNINVNFGQVLYFH